MKLFICKHCGNIIQMVKDAGVPVMCCGQKMELLVPNTTDGAFEKHVPVVSVSGNKVVVSVGSTLHPMMEEHHIAFVILETKNTVQKVELNHTEQPVAEFSIVDGDEVVAAYEYCNLHGFWKSN